MKQVRLYRAFAILPLLLLAIPLSNFILSAFANFDRTSLGRSSLWHVVHLLCVPSANIGIPLPPCLNVQDEHGGKSGWAYLKVGNSHILTIPTSRTSGIESPSVMNNSLPNLWDIAWEGRKYLPGFNNGTLRRDQIALAINSSIGRSQDQLHIHTSCIRPDVVATIQKEASGISSEWRYMYDDIDGNYYKVKSIEAEDLKDFNIFYELPRSIRLSQSRMAKQTLVVIAATLPNGKNGFYLLNDQAMGKNIGYGEGLLDTSCSAK